MVIDSIDTSSLFVSSASGRSACVGPEPEGADIVSFAPLEPLADGFRNYLRAGLEDHAAALLIDKAQLLTLTAPEMSVLVGDLRALDANGGQTRTAC